MTLMKAMESNEKTWAETTKGKQREPLPEMEN